jgi:hypothetical protein
MKWFKHDTDASTDAKIKKLLLKHGAEGYAIYFHCIELIAGSISDQNITFQLEHDAEIIADNLKIKGDNQLSAIDKVNNIMKTIIDLQLFEESNNKIYCLKLAKRIDQSMTSNPKMRKMINCIKQSHDTVMINHDTVMQDKIRLDKIRIDNNKEAVKESSKKDEVSKQSKDKTDNPKSRSSKKKEDGRPPAGQLKAIYNDWLISLGKTQEYINRYIFGDSIERQQLSNIYKKFADCDEFKYFLSQIKNNDWIIKQNNITPRYLIGQVSKMMDGYKEYLRKQSENNAEYKKREVEFMEGWK